jgi:hypothetical protein
MQIRINQSHLQYSHRPPQSEFVDGGSKVGIEESTVEDGETDTAADEAEVVEVLGIDSGVAVDLERVVALVRLLELFR